MRSFCKVRCDHPNREIPFALGGRLAFPSAVGDVADRSVEMKAKGFLSSMGPNWSDHYGTGIEAGRVVASARHRRRIDAKEAE